MAIIQEHLLDYFLAYEGQAILLSILLNITVAVAGIVPSVFITGANIAFFGFWSGIGISLAGEIIGANVAFYLYRKGFKKSSKAILDKYPKIKKLVYSDGQEAFYLILLFRILPFIPSGFVTFAAAVGKVSLGIFMASSTLGKIPALFIEAVSVYQLMKITVIKEALIEVGLIILIYNLWQRYKRR